MEMLQRLLKLFCRLFVALTGIQYAGGHLRELQKAVKVFNDYIVPQLLYIYCLSLHEIVFRCYRKP